MLAVSHVRRHADRDTLTVDTLSGDTATVSYPTVTEAPP